MRKGWGGAGYTLAELVVAIVIVGMVAAMTAPSLRAYNDRARTRGALNRWVADANLTRILAIRSGHRAVLRFVPDPDCPSRGGVYAGSSWTVTIRGPSPRVAKTTSLRDEGRGTCVSSNRSDSVAFSSRGLLLPAANRQVWARRGAAMDSVVVSVAGRFYRRF